MKSVNPLHDSRFSNKLTPILLNFPQAKLKQMVDLHGLRLHSTLDFIMFVNESELIKCLFLLSPYY